MSAEAARIAKLEQRMDNFEKENERRNLEMMKAIEAIELEQKASIERDHSKDLEMGEMKNDIKTILTILDTRGPKRTAMIVTLIGLLLVGIQTFSMIQANHLSQTMVELSKSLAK